MDKLQIREKCRKCGSGDVIIQYDKVLDLLRKTCRRCTYSWDEDCLDVLLKGGDDG